MKGAWKDKIYQRATLVLIIKVKTIFPRLPPPVSPCLILYPTHPLPPQLPCSLPLHPTNLPIVQNCTHWKKKTYVFVCFVFGQRTRREQRGSISVRPSKQTSEQTVMVSSTLCPAVHILGPLHPTNLPVVQNCLVDIEKKPYVFVSVLSFIFVHLWLAFFIAEIQTVYSADGRVISPWDRETFWVFFLRKILEQRSCCDQNREKHETSFSSVPQVRSLTESKGTSS